MGEAKRKAERIAAAKLCIYCGVACQPTMDHVPPRALFPLPRPQNLITVPSCKTCNEAAGKYDDEKFKAAIALQLDPRAGGSRGALALSGQSTLKKNQRLIRDFFASGQDVLVENNGAFVVTRAFLWDADSHDDVIKRITRGLYWKETGTSLFSRKCDVDAYFYGNSDAQVQEIAKAMNIRKVGDSQFVYAFAIASEDPRISLWLYNFYGAHFAGAATRPV